MIDATFSPDSTTARCPLCGQSLHLFQRGISGKLVSYWCLHHGRFGFDAQGTLRSLNFASNGRQEITGEGLTGAQFIANRR